MDTCVGRLLDKLEELGIRKKTIVVYTSDHGEMLFEHGDLQKHCFYEGAVAVPFVISAPGVIPEGAKFDAFTSLIDLLPTLLDLTGIPHPEALEGESLVSVLEGRDERKDGAVFSEFYSKGSPERMIRTAKWKYVHTHADIAQLYDVENDPLERKNLASDPACADVCKELDARVKDGWEFPPSDIKMKLRPGQPRRQW